MPKRKWNRLHDDGAIDRERTHRSQRLGERREARSEIVEALAGPTADRSPDRSEPEAAGEASPTPAPAAKRDE
jgi:hypothetical protein